MQCQAAHPQAVFSNSLCLFFAVTLNRPFLRGRGAAASTLDGSARHGCSTVVLIGCTCPAIRTRSSGASSSVSLDYQKTTVKKKTVKKTTVQGASRLVIPLGLAWSVRGSASASCALAVATRDLRTRRPTYAVFHRTAIRVT